MGLLAEQNSNENFASFTSRLGTYSSHQAAANATGTTSGFRDSLTGIAVPLKLTLALSGNEKLYLKVGLAKAWTNAASGNLTETDSNSLSGQFGLNYRPNRNLVLCLGLVAGQTDLNFRHNGGSSSADYLGIQFEYMHKLSNSAGLAARMIWSNGTNDTAIPQRNSGQILRVRQGVERIYAEASLLADLPKGAFSFLPKGVKLRPVATLMYQSSTFADTVNSLGRARSGSKEELGTARLAVRIEKEERRQWRLAPFAVLGAEHEFVNTVSRVDHDPASTYLKAGLGMNAGGHGKIDLYYVRRDSFKGTYSSNQITLFASLLF